MFSKLSQMTGSMSMRPQFARQMLRATQHNTNGSRWISTSNEDKRSDVLTQNQQQQQSNEKLKLEQQERARTRRTERFLSTLNYSVPLAANGTAVSKDESREFMSVFPDLVRDLTEKTKKYDSKDASLWLARALQYNVPRGKKNRGLATVQAYKSLVEDQTQLKPENVRLAHYLGWCIEMLQSTFLITDDIMDGSETRRGQPCWYKVDDVKFTAINDALMIESCIYYILKKHFSDQPSYVKLVELFHETMLITTIGQSLDLQTANKDVECFTMDRYNSIVTHKTAYYTFYLPVALAMHLAGYEDPEVFRQVKTILLEMGQFFQIQDDFLDCFGNPEVTGKVGTDIQDNKCTWLAVLCMQRATPEQKKIMKECYGSNDVEKINRVKQLYEDLGIPHTYSLYEEESYNLIKTHIQQTSRGVPHKIFFKIMDKIYRRDS